MFVQHLHHTQVTVELLKEYNIVDQEYSPPGPTKLTPDERKVHENFCYVFIAISLHNFACIINY